MDTEKRTVGETIMEWTKSFGLMLDYLKVTRRTVMVVYGVFLYQTSQWFFSLPDPTTQQVTYVTAILGLAGIIFGFYSNSPSDYMKLDQAKVRQRDGYSGMSQRNNYRNGGYQDNRGYQDTPARRPVEPAHSNKPDVEEEGFWDDTEN